MNIKLQKKADKLKDQLAEVIKQMAKEEPFVSDETGGSYENQNGRQVVRYAENVATQMLEAANTDCLGGCFLCRS